MFDWILEADIVRLERDIAEATFEFERQRLRELRQIKVDQLTQLNAAVRFTEEVS